MTDLVLGIRITADGKEVVREVRFTQEEVQKIAQVAQKANDQAKAAADQFVQSLKRQADTLGMTKAQTQAYEASQHQLTQAQRDGVAQSIIAIQSHERYEAMLARVKTAAYALAATITTALVVALKSSISEAARAEQAHLKLEAVLKATSYAAGLSKMELDAQAEALKRSTGFDDDQIRSSMAVMLTFKQVQGDTFRQAMVMATDLSKLLGQDLQSSVMMLGKALEDPEGGLLALRRAGVSFTDAQKDAIKSMVEFGEQGRALTTILTIMREQGLDQVAEAMNTGYQGAFNNATNAMSDFFKMIGNFAIVKTPVTGFLNEFSNYLTDIKNVMESGDWVDKLALFTVGYSTPSLLEARNPTAAAATTNQKKVVAEMSPEGAPESEGWTKLMAEQEKALNKVIEEAVKKRQDAEERLRAAGEKGWVAYAEAIFRAADEENLAMEKIHDAANKREATAEQELENIQNRFNATLAQAIQNIELQNMTEMELLQHQTGEKQAWLDSALEKGYINEKFYAEQVTRLHDQEVKKRFGISKVYRELDLESATFALSQLAGFMESKNRQMFEVGKAAAIGETIANTYRAAMGSYAALASIPFVGPYLGAAAAAAAIVVGMSRVQQIRSTQFGGGSVAGGASPVFSANPTTGVPDAPIGGSQAPPSVPTAAAPPQEVHIHFEGGADRMFSYKEVAEELIPLINEAAGNSVNITVTT